MTGADPSPPGGAGASGTGGELGLRVVSALVLGALSVGLLWAGLWPFSVLLLIIALAVGWEWGRLVRGTEWDASLIFHTGAVAAAVALAAFDLAAIGLIVLLVVALVMLVLRIARGDWLSGAGVLYVGLPALALVWLRSDSELGFHAVLFLFVAVWSTDVLAYVTGKAIGGPRLWPAVSPGKTWAGSIGGAVAGMACGAGFALAFGGQLKPLELALLGLAMSVAAQLGDLAESALKRRAGRKDASALVPGHGGLLDRVDGLMLAASVAGLLALARDPIHPAAAVLVW